jgi:hypothetical protein
MLEDKKQIPQLLETAVIASAFSDTKLESMINYWLDYYTKKGNSHYSDTKDWRIREIYWDKIVDRVIEDLNIEMTDSEIEKFCDRLADL